MTELWWPDISPPLSPDEKELLKEIYHATKDVGFFGSTDECDYIEALAIAVRITRAKDNEK